MSGSSHQNNTCSNGQSSSSPSVASLFIPLSNTHPAYSSRSMRTTGLGSDA
eukprot:CAMPEP_0196191138 /NCGR_PEP_ID=MMETSP0911-20130528/47638_1 /TAXON_ID=49265 /ORGANISM="Thalassiosira rotula, Strain GSO102" /LENGTH=50 /DNA_ID=CAMNT_0041463139 /DNA_START=60 /DNA_END=212 /DNA_ORIENTATION=+